ISYSNPAYNMASEVHQRNDAIGWIRRDCQNKAGHELTYKVQELKVLNDQTASVKVSEEETYTQDGHRVAAQSAREYMIKWVDEGPKVAFIKVTQLHA